jgi:Alginate lyase
MNKNGTYLMLLVLCVFLIGTIPTAMTVKSVNNEISFTHPGMFLDQSEINVIKTRLNQEPWKTAYDKFMSKDVSVAMNTPIQSVTYGGKTPSSGDKHDYYSDHPYLSDGVYDPNADRTDYESAMAIGHSVRDLGLAYAITGDSKYADKAVQLINAWTVDPTTRMNPTVRIFNAQSYIEPVLTIPGMFYGADLIWNYPGWSDSDKNAFKDWVSKFTTWAKSWEGYNDNNNYELRRVMTVAAGAVITENSDDTQYAIDRWKYVMPLNMNAQGLMVKEYERTRGLFYSLTGINALITTAEIVRHQGIDLYNYKTSDGKGIKLALDFYAPYASGKSIWPYKEIRWDLIEYGMFELAYSAYGNVDYKDIIVKRGRPMYEIRIMGPITLTHADTYIDITPGLTTTRTPVPTVTQTPVPTIGPTPDSIKDDIYIYCYKRRRVL